MQDIIQWAAAATGVVAAILVASKSGHRITGIGFVIFCVSSAAWTTVGVLEEQHGLIVQNVVLTAVNILGVYRYLIHDAHRPISLPERPR